MKSSTFVILLVVALAAGIGIGLWLVTSRTEAASTTPPQALQLSADDQSDYILNVADAYAVNGDLELARHRLARLQDPQILLRIETFAINSASLKTPGSLHLIQLALALGSTHSSLVAMVATPTFTPTTTPTPENAPVFSSVRATITPTDPPTLTPSLTPEPVYIVVPNDNPYIILPTNTPTITPTRLPNTRVPPTLTPLPTNTAAPPPPVLWEPGLDRWWGTIYYEPVNVEPGTGYWHLSHAVYCDAYAPGESGRFDFGCDELPGGGAGTSIYVMTGGAPIDVIAPDGRNVGDDTTIVGDAKAPGDMCNCSWSFESSNYKISVRGAPSDAVGGFCLCGKNFGWGSRAHVRYFLYFDYVIR